MRASARLGTELTPSAKVNAEVNLDGVQRHTRTTLLHSDWPLMLRPTRATEPASITAWAGVGAARVHVAGAAAGPVGGDQLGLHVDVGAQSTLILGEVSPTLLLPGPHGEQSRTAITATVGPFATLVWLPQLVIAAHGCHHRTDTRITLQAGARLLVREEVRFGRHDEGPGQLRQRLRISSEDGPIHDQELTVGPAEVGWNGPAVTAGAHSAGSLLVIDPTATGTPIIDTPATDTAMMALAGSGVLANALAPDTATLRRRLDHALITLVGPETVTSPRPDRAPV